MPLPRFKSLFASRALRSPQAKSSHYPLASLLIALFLSGLGLANVSSSWAKTAPTHPELQKILDLKPQKTPAANIQNDALAQIAQEVALATGAKTRYGEILELLEPLAKELDATFDFEPLVIKKGQLYLEPPVVMTLTAVVSLLDPLAAKDQGLTYRLIRSGRLLTRPPHWRDYLFAPSRLELKEPEEIPGSLRPESAEEKKIWTESALLGWSQGEKLADRLFQKASARLTRDYLGLLRFWDLERLGLIEGPTLETNEAPFQSQPQELVWDAAQYRISSPGRFVDLKAQKKLEKKNAKAKRPKSNSLSPLSSF